MSEVIEKLGLVTKYFVLNPTKTNEYGEASRVALSAYADEIESFNKNLALGIRVWVESLDRKL